MKTEVTLDDVIGEFLKSRDYIRLAPKTKTNYLSATDELRSLLGSMPIKSISRRDVENLMSGLLPTPGQANVTLSVLKRIMAYAIRQDYLEANPCAQVRPCDLGSYKRWPDDLIQTFLNLCTNMQVKTAMMAGIYTGMRIGDIASIKWDWIEEEYGHLADPDKGEQIILQVKQQKTGTPLSLPLPEALHRYLMGIQVGSVYDLGTGKPEGACFPTNAKLLSNAFGKECKRQGIPNHKAGGYCFHGLRKTAAARLAEAGCTTREIMAITGHRTLKEVERYTREAEQSRLAQSAIRKLEAA